MFVKVKVNSGTILKGNIVVKLNKDTLKRILEVKDYKKLIPEFTKNKDFVKSEKLLMRDDMELYNAIKNNQPIKIVSVKKRGFYHTLVFKF